MKKTRIMYIEHKGDGLSGPARIGRVSFTKSGKSIYYRGKLFTSLSGYGFKANYHEAESGDYYWISGCKKDGTDRLYSGTVAIDEDVREEYWTEIRKLPEKKAQRSIRSAGKYQPLAGKPFGLSLIPSRSSFTQLDFAREAVH